jgi:hypothetical protein
LIKTFSERIKQQREIMQMQNSRECDKEAKDAKN